MASEVFISHASADERMAVEVCEAIEARGLPCWLASRDITPGRDYPSAIAEALSVCRALVLILSHEAAASQHVVREVERAVDRGILIIPLRIQPVELSSGLGYLLSSVQWLDATAIDRSAALQLVLRTLQQKLGPSAHSTQPAMASTQPTEGGTPDWWSHFSGNLRGAALLVAAFALLAVTWFNPQRPPQPVSTSTSGGGGTPAEPEPHPASAGSAPTPDPGLASGGRLGVEPSAGGGGKGAGTPVPYPQLCCTDAGVGKYCARLRCEDCGLRTCQ